MSEHAKQVAALVAVTQSVIEELGKHGRVLKAPAIDALALVDGWVAGAPVTDKALDTACGEAFQDKLPLALREQDRAVGFANAAVSTLAWVARKRKDWKGGVTNVLDSLSYALARLEVADARDRDALQVLFDASLSRAAPAPRAPAPRKQRVDLSEHIGEVANAWFQREKAEQGELLPSKAAAAKDFDARYGAVAIDGWAFGSGAEHGETAKGLVPVISTPNDVVFFLDARGKAWGMDTIEDLKPTPFADDADVMVARTALVQFSMELKRVSEAPGRSGAVEAKRRKLPKIPEATDSLGAAWGTTKALVLESREDKGWVTRVYGKGRG